MTSEGISLLKLLGFTTTVAIIEYVWLNLEQLEYIKALNSNVLNVEVIHRIWDILWEFKDPQYVYRKWVLVPKE